MKTLCFLLTLLVSTSSFTNSQLENKEVIADSKQAPAFKLYTITGTFYVGIVAYTYELIIDATICLTCQPPYIHINSVQGVTICLRNTTTCGSVGVQSIRHDSSGNLESIEFSVDDITNEDEIEEHINKPQFQEIIKEQLFELER